MKRTRIAWCDSTMNFWIGCTKDGPDCLNCYAEAGFDKRRHMAEWGPSGTRKITSLANWNNLHKWNDDKWIECFGCGWRGDEKEARSKERSDWECPVCRGSGFTPTKQRVFVMSLGDFFEKRADLATPRKIALMNMARYRNLTYLVLTKRTDEAPQMILDAVGNCAEFLQSNQHIMIGGSAGNQAGADRRIAHLLSIPGNSRPWLSAEPLIGALDLTRVAEKHRAETINALHRGLEFQRELQWVVVGGESQTGARPANPAWVKKIKADCEATGTTFFFKQWGEWVPVQEIGDDLGDGMYRIKEQYKKAANGSRWGVWEGDTFCEMKSRFVVDCLAEDSMIRIGKKNDPETLDGEQYHNWPAGHYWN